MVTEHVDITGENNPSSAVGDWQYTAQRLTACLILSG